MSVTTNEPTRSAHHASARSTYAVNASASGASPGGNTAASSTSPCQGREHSQIPPWHPPGTETTRGPVDSARTFLPVSAGLATCSDPTPRAAATSSQYDTAMAVIVEGSMAALTFKAMSERVGYSPQAIHQWYGTRDEFIVVVAATFCQRWTQWVWRRGYSCALLALLPEEEHEVRWTRVLMAVEEQARVQADLAPILADLRESERQLMMRLHPRLAGEASEGGDELPIVTLVVTGLRAALCRADDPTKRWTAHTGHAARRPGSPWPARSTTGCPAPRQDRTSSLVD